MRANEGTWDHFNVQLNNGNGFDPPVRWNGVDSRGGMSWWGSVSNSVRDSYGHNNLFLTLQDINGDGLPDRVMRADADGPAYDHFNVQLNNGSGFDPVIRWNGVYSYGGSGWWGAIRSDYPDSSGRSNALLDLQDINGDGLPDRIMRANEGTWDHFNVQLNNGSGFDPPIRWSGVYSYGASAWWGSISNSVRDSGFNNLFLALQDINGDGLPDRIMRADADGPAYDHFNVQLNPDFLPDLLISLENGLGGEVQITYRSSTKFKGEISNLPFPVPVVTAIKSSDGQGNSYSTTFEYKNGLYDWQDREFRGFGYVKAIDATGSYSETYFKQDDIYKGRPYLQQAKDAQGKLYTKSETSWNYTQPYTGVYFPYISQTDNYIYDGDTTYKQTRARFEYDTYGNPTKVVSEGEVGVTGDEKTQVTEYVYNTSKWLLAFPKYTYLLNAQGVKISEKWFYYDNAAAIETLPTSGLLTKEEVLVTNPITQQSFKSAAQLSYDAYGNLKSATDALGRATTTIYETDLNTYPIKVINALGQTVQSTYNYTTGQVLTSTDPNNQVTRNIYDVLSRLIKVIGPNDTETYPASSYEYQLSTFPIKITTRIKADYASPANYLTSYEFSDGLGRLIQTKSPAEPHPQTAAQRQIISGAVVFDSRGQVKEQYLPCFAATSTEYVAPTYATPHASFIYDSMGRLVKQTNPDATYSTVSYSDWKKSTTDENGHIRAEYSDAYGQIIKIEEYNQGQIYTTTYTYDTLGNLVKVTDNQNNISQIWYDSLGRKIKMNDPDMGVWAYEYDAVGNLIKQTDAKAQVLLFDYDVLNRLTRKYTSTQTRATYLYDDLLKGNCIGRLSKIIDLSGSTEFFYDNLGRETKSTKTVSGSSYTVERSYDALDRLVSLKYPDGEILTYTYNPQGIERVQGAVSYIANIDYLPTGQIAKINYANGVETNYAYDPNTLRLNSLISQSAKGRIQDLSYQFDSVGNIKQIGDYVNTATQNFIYDDLDRLIQAQGAYGSFAYTYDSIGNMLHKEGVNLIYGKNGRLPHAVTQYGATLLNYDANGNMITGKGKTLTYDVENRLLSVNQSGTISSFVYDGDGGRVKKTAGTSSTVYIGSLFEKSSSGKTTKYIFAGANRIASKESTGSTYYYHSDHLGSSNVVTDASATQVGFTEFTPYGSTFRKTGTYDPKFKFTGKELDNTGLYFYGARYYDPEIGRFISADTIVQAPYDPQSLNRYSYCRNNPINYVDPTGHSWFSKWWGKIVGAVAGIIGTILTGNMMVGFQLFNFFSSLQSTVSTGSWGAFAGGLAGGLIGGYVGGTLAGQVAGALGKSAFTFGGGFLIGATEMGAAGFGGSFGGALGRGASFGEAMKQGAIGFGIGAAVGGLVEGSYLGGMQNIAHGQSRGDIYEAGIKRLNALSVKNADKTTAIVGSRPLSEPPSSTIGRHRYIRGRAGWFEMGPDETTGLIEINGENSLGATAKYVNGYKSQLLEATVTVSQSGFNKAIDYYNAAWVKIPTQYSWKSYNSNYAVNSVIYGAGANVPENLGYTPGFPDTVK
jgi:RHS repeat-associated protein